MRGKDQPTSKEAVNEFYRNARDFPPDRKRAGGPKLARSRRRFAHADLPEAMLTAGAPLLSVHRHLIATAGYISTFAGGGRSN